VTAGEASADEPTLVIGRAAAEEGAFVTLPAPPLIAPALSCALAAARASDTRLQYDSEVPAFTLTWKA
jgi:hypothetical protein